MRLLLSQLFYTTFPDTGFQILASPQVPKEIERVFSQQIIARYWNAYNPPPSGYQAAYLHQVTPEHTLLGWLYNDGADELGRSHVPYFVCYHLAQPLLDFELKCLFTCLQLGPLFLIDRHRPPETVPQFIVQDMDTYQSVRPGVSIPTSLQKQSLIALQECKSIDLFVPKIDRHILQLDAQNSLEEHQATLAIYERSFLDTDVLSSPPLTLTEASSLVIPKEDNLPNNLLAESDVKDDLKRYQIREKLILVGLFASLLAFGFGLYALIYALKSPPKSGKNPSYIPSKFENVKRSLNKGINIHSNAGKNKGDVHKLWETAIHLG